MAEGWARELGSDVMEIYSAGTENYPEVKPKAVDAMKMAGVDISGQYPKLIEDIPHDLDYLITMGCGVACPYVPAKKVEDWGLEDPSGGSIEDFCATRDIIKEKILSLISEIKSNH
jgi:arsenate reductase